jgi:hypothetical protein
LNIRILQPVLSCLCICNRNIQIVLHSAKYPAVPDHNSCYTAFSLWQLSLKEAALQMALCMSLFESSLLYAFPPHRPGNQNKADPLHCRIQKMILLIMHDSMRQRKQSAPAFSHHSANINI